jgi:hypothetical protein
LCMEHFRYKQPNYKITQLPNPRSFTIFFSDFPSGVLL